MNVNRTKIITAGFCVALILSVAPVFGADKEAEGLKTETVSQGANETGRNDPARGEWFKDQTLGMFIHWSMDCPLGTVISHHLVGSTQAYQDRFFTQMPGAVLSERFQARPLGAKPSRTANSRA
jgi:hypothetical protein